MKTSALKIISLSLILIALPSKLSAQTIEIYEEEEWEPIGEDISGTVVEVFVDPGDSPAIVRFVAKNTSDETLNLRLERFKLEDALGSQDFIYWGTSIEDGALYSPDFVTDLNPFITPDNFDIDPDGFSIFWSYYNVETSIGCSYYRYYLIDDSDVRLDSLDLNFCSTLAVSESELYDISIFPNPATDFIQLDYPAEMNENAMLEIADITGGIIISTSLSPT
ncbi:MAG: hypothetical protein ACI8ZM_005167, partial [Crocinitomix sp.]